MRRRRGVTEDYLRGLARWAPRDTRHELVLEASRHLYDASQRYQALGLTEEEAVQLAVLDFGAAWRVGLAARGLTLTRVPSSRRRRCRRWRLRRLSRPRLF